MFVPFYLPHLMIELFFISSVTCQEWKFDSIILRAFNNKMIWSKVYRQNPTVN